MKNGNILGCLFSGVIIACVLVLCFLPTVFYKNPVELPSAENHLNLSIANAQPSFPCNPPLIFSNNSRYCKPRCDWLPFSNEEQRGILIADWITALFCTICFSIVLITWFKLPEFMKFPHFIILLMAGISAVIEILVLISKFAPPSKLFCSSQFLDEAIVNPTTFCQTQGCLIHYASLVVGELFAIYNAVLLKHLVIDKRPSEGYSKKFQTALFLAVLILPILPVIYVLKIGDNYTAVNFRHCFPKDTDEGFYTCLLPQQFFFAFGVTCLLLVIFKLIKERKSSLIGSPTQARRRQIQMQKIAIQFIMVIISYSVCVYLSYGVICIQMNNRKAYKMLLKRYYACLIFSENCPQDFREYDTSYAVLIMFLLAGNVFQGGTFILLVGKQKVRNLWRSWLFHFTGCCRSTRKIPHNSTSSSVLALQPNEEKKSTTNDTSTTQ